MPRKLKDIILGPFAGGLNTRLSEQFVGPQDAVTATNVDLSDGTLRGHYGLSTGAGIDSPAGTNTIWFEAPSTWAGSADRLYVLYGPDWTTADTRKATYRTQASGLPLVVVNGDSYNLGLPAPLGWDAFITVSNGGSGGVRAYAFTYYSSTLEWESNPEFITDTTTGCNGAQIAGMPTTGHAAVDYKNIYATQPGSTSGTYYYIGQVAIGTATFDDAATAGDTALALNWKAGGNPDDVDYPYDHGNWASVDVLADSLYSVAEGAGAGGGGILMGADGNTFWWSMLGFPWYRPATNEQRFDSRVVAITCGEGVAHVYTETAIYQVTGTDDAALSITRTGAAFGVQFEAGRSVASTPYGTFFKAAAGIGHFDGQNARLISEGVLSPDPFLAGLSSGWVGSFGNDMYVLANPDLGDEYVVNLAAWPDRLQVVKTEFTITAIVYLADSTFNALGWLDGWYVGTGGGTIENWDPKTGFGAERGSWVWKTGRLNHGDPTGLKRYTRWYLDGAASSISFSVDGSEVHSVSTVDNEFGWLPRTAYGTDIQVEITGLDPLVRLLIECEAPRG